MGGEAIDRTELPAMIPRHVLTLAPIDTILIECDYVFLHFICVRASTGSTNNRKLFRYTYKCQVRTSYITGDIIPARSK